MRWVLCALMLVCAAPAPAQENAGVIGAALDAAGEGDWDTAAALAEPLGGVATDLVTWLRLRDGAAVFQDYAAFLERNGHWPGPDRLRAEAERVMPEQMPPEAVVAFFEEAPPETGAGVIRLAEARRALGEVGLADALIVEAWLTRPLGDEAFARMLEGYPELLAPQHGLRTEMLLWRERTGDAERMLPLLDEGLGALAEARIALLRGDRDVAARLGAVPEALRDHPGLAYGRYARLARRGEYSEAIEIVLGRSGSAASLGEPFRWSGWRRILARFEMRQGDPERAYEIASRHFLTEGRNFADLEWLSGYIALRLLEDPERALGHFETFDAAVETPISVARSGYWRGMAQRALGDDMAARAALAEAAAHQTAFYGLLAAEELGLSLDPDLAGGEVFPDWQDGDLLSRDLVQAALLLLAAEERGLAVLFIAELGRTLERDELGQLGDLLTEMDEDFLTILMAKAGVRRGMLLNAHYHPLHDLAAGDWPVETALALAIARQESEFRADAGSPVGALGLMQLMPGTAQEVADALELPYARGRLTSDWVYNATLGTAYLAILTEEFGPSPVLIAAGYNAGPGRPRQWMSERGDPRLGQIDPVDWIEMIPFRETRNYAMRVTEAIPVYRLRLGAEPGPVAFREILVGALPLIRPRARPEGPRLPARGESPPPLRQAPGEAVRVNRGAGGPQVPGGPRTVAPPARPGDG